jgi:ubiquinone/menaquinone biosynthesis C-methylase UbiE
VTGNASERLARAVEIQTLDPDGRVLEIGCGHGVAVWLVCERLVDGTITAIDRSAQMIAMASRHNQEHVAAGRATFIQAALEDAGLGDRRSDKVLAVHVNLFRQKPRRQLQVICDVLKPGGVLYLIDQPLDPGAIRDIAAHTAAGLLSHGFTIRDTIVGGLPSGPILCVVSEPE